jgi:hypothetical protein
MMRILAVTLLLGIKCWYFSAEEDTISHILEAHRWRAPDGSGLGINHGEALNPVIGFLAERLYADVDSVLLYPFLVNVSVPRELYLYVLRGYSDIFFDSILLGKDEDTLINEEVCLSKLLRGVPEADSQAFLARLVAVGLGKQVNPVVFDEAIMGNAHGKEKEHVKMVRLLGEYLSQPESSYTAEGRVDIDKFLGSKTFLIQAMINKCIRKASAGTFYNMLYLEIADNPGIVEKYYSGNPVDTRYEELMKRGLGFIERGALLAKLDPKLMVESCTYHGSHDTVGLTDSDRCAILSLLCVAFYNPKSRKYSVEHLPHPKEELVKFFAQHPEPFKYQEVEEEWCRVVENLGDEIEYRAGRGEDRIVPTFLNVCRAICDLCGIQGGRSAVQMAIEIRSKLVFSKCRDDTRVFDVLDRIISPAKILEISLGGDDSGISSIDVGSLLSADGAAYMGAKIGCSEERAKFEVLEWTYLGENEVSTGNIVDYLAEVYLRYYHNELRMDTALGRGEYRYISLWVYGEEVHERYIALCLDSIFANKSKHPRLQEIRDLAVEHKSGLVQKVFAAAVKGERYEITREVVGRVGANLLNYLIRYSSKVLPDSVLEDVICVAIANNRRDILRYISENVSRDVMEQGFVYGFHLLIRDAFVVYFDKILNKPMGEADYVFRAYRYSVLLQEYCSSEILTPEVERGAVGYCYDYFFGRQGSLVNDLSLTFLVGTTLDQVDTQMLYGYLREFIPKDSEYWFIWKMLSKIAMENLHVPRELFGEMQQLYEEKLGSEEDPSKHRRLEHIIKMLLDIEHEGLIVEGEFNK